MPNKTGIILTLALSSLIAVSSPNKVAIMKENNEVKKTCAKQELANIKPDPDNEDLSSSIQLLSTKLEEFHSAMSGRLNNQDNAIANTQNTAVLFQHKMRQAEKSLRARCC